jgi:hypothetical protein
MRWAVLMLYSATLRWQFGRQPVSRGDAPPRRRCTKEFASLAEIQQSQKCWPDAQAQRGISLGCAAPCHPPAPGR